MGFKVFSYRAKKVKLSEKPLLASFVFVNRELFLLATEVRNIADQ